MTDHRSACPVCGHDKSIEFLKGSIDQERLTGFSYASRKEPEFMNFPYVRCLECDLVYASTLPTLEMLDSAYSEADYDSSEEADLAAKTYAKIMGQWIKKLPRKTCAVDIGTGNGTLLPLLAQQGFQTVIGIEPSTTAINAAPADVKPMIRTGLFTKEIIADVQPDFICTSMTMEHVNDPLALCKIAQETLSTGGMLAVVVHNRCGVLNRILGRKSPIIDIEHLQLFNFQSLDRLFKEAGLKTLSIAAFSNTYPLRYWVRLLPLPNSFKRVIISVLQTLRLAQIKITLPVGNMLGIAQK